MSIRISLQCTYNFMDYLKKKKDSIMKFGIQQILMNAQYEKSSLIYLCCFENAPYQGLDLLVYLLIRNTRTPCTLSDLSH